MTAMIEPSGLRTVGHWSDMPPGHPVCSQCGAVPTARGTKLIREDIHVDHVKGIRYHDAQMMFRPCGHSFPTVIMSPTEAKV